MSLTCSAVQELARSGRPIVAEEGRGRPIVVDEGRQVSLGGMGSVTSCDCVCLSLLSAH